MCPLQQFPPTPAERRALKSGRDEELADNGVALAPSTSAQANQHSAKTAANFTEEEIARRHTAWTARQASSPVANIAAARRALPIAPYRWGK